MPDGNLRSLHLYCEDSGRFMVILEFFGAVMVIERDVSMFRFCRVVGLSYVAVLGVDFVFQLCRILSEEIL